MYVNDNAIKLEEKEKKAVKNKGQPLGTSNSGIKEGKLLSTLDLEGAAPGTPETGLGGEGTRTATLTSVKEQGSSQPAAAMAGREGRELYTVRICSGLSFCSSAGISHWPTPNINGAEGKKLVLRARVNGGAKRNYGSMLVKKVVNSALEKGSLRFEGCLDGKHAA